DTGRGRHVFAHVLRRAVDQHSGVALPRRERQPLEILAARGVERLTGAREGERGPSTALLEVELREGDELVIPGDAPERAGPRDLHAGVRLCAITHQIAQAENAFGSMAIELAERRLERANVTVHVGENAPNRHYATFFRRYPASQKKNGA